MAATDTLSWIAIAVSVFAIVATGLSFWFTYGRLGRLETVPPHTFAVSSAGTTVLMLRLPLVMFNTGGRATVVIDLRCWFPRETGQVLSLPWRRQCATLLAGPDHEGSPVPSPFRDVPASPCLLSLEGHSRAWRLVPAIPTRSGSSAVKTVVGAGIHWYPFR